VRQNNREHVPRKAQFRNLVSIGSVRIALDRARIRATMVNARLNQFCRGPRSWMPWNGCCCFAMKATAITT
jgi:hypothetical protein